jgi:hypothetical protein
MAYHPKTVRTRWVRDAVLAALREHEQLNTTKLCEAIGSLTVGHIGVPQWCVKCRGVHDGPVQWNVTSQIIQPTLTSMERHDEIARYRRHPADLWIWYLGPQAPAPVDVDELEALL